MARYPKPAEGSWTEHYPGLGTEPVSYEDSISPDLYELEREAIFKRAWLQVGRLEQIPRTGSFLTKKIAAAKTSIIVVRDGDDVRAFHNVCRHRGNQLVWQDFPHEETSGTARQFTCKYHGWRYGLDGACTFAQQEGEFFDLDRADYGLVPVHCDVFAGFIFVNFAKEPRQSLREFLGPMLLGVEDYPFHEMTDRYAFSVECRANWKVFSDAFMEFYHAPVVHVGQHPRQLRAGITEMGYEAPHYQIDGPHGLVTTAGSLHRVWDMPPENVKPADIATRSGLFGPWEQSDLGELPVGINPGKVNPWGLSSFQFFPNFSILIWQAGWYNTHQFWPTSHNTVIFEGNVYSLPAKSAAERVGPVLEPVATGRWPGDRAQWFSHPVHRVGAAGRLEQRQPDVLVLLEADRHLLADVDLVGVAPDDVGGEMDRRVLRERDVGDHVRRFQARQPLIVVDGEGDHRAPPRDHPRLPLLAPARRADRHGRVHQLSAVGAALDPKAAVGT